MCIRDRFRGATAFGMALMYANNCDNNTILVAKGTYKPHRRAFGVTSGSNCTYTVSYTHLDVYKRQGTAVLLGAVWWTIVASGLRGVGATFLSFGCCERGRITF